MDGILKVTPEKLRSTASSFSSSASEVNSITSQMMQLVKALGSSWQGEASSAYLTKFGQLQDDMDKMHRMIQEHVQDLNDMADKYQQAENASADLGNSLEGDVIQ